MRSEGALINACVALQLSVHQLRSLLLATLLLRLDQY
jgi:hypothetical protein